MTQSTTPGRVFYERQIVCLENGDIDGLVEQYHADAVLVSFDRIVRGKANIRKHMEGYLANLGSFKLKSTDKFIETEDSIFFEATMLTAHAEAQVYDIFILREGKATHQFVGVLAIHPIEVPASEG